MLGIYLGDGTVLRYAKDVFALHVFQDARYPGVIGEIVRATRAVMPRNKVSVYRRYAGANMVVIACYSKTRPQVIPQTGPGMKHTRKIELPHGNGRTSGRSRAYSYAASSTAMAAAS